MPRSEARWHTSAWTDDGFITLPASAQRFYFLLVSQPGISLLGVQALTPARWAHMAPDTTVDDVENALVELEGRRFVVVDQDTQEVLVRSFIRHDGVWKSPRTRVAAMNQRAAIVSKSILAAVDVEIQRLEDGSEEEKPQIDTLSDTPADSVADGVSDRHRAYARADSDSVSYSIAPSNGASEKPRDELFDAVVKVCEIDTSQLTTSARGALNRAVNDLRNIGANPEQVLFKAYHYRRKFRGAALTPNALAKHWASLNDSSDQVVEGPPRDLEVARL